MFVLGALEIHIWWWWWWWWWWWRWWCAFRSRFCRCWWTSLPSDGNRWWCWHSTGRSRRRSRSCSRQKDSQTRMSAPSFLVKVSLVRNGSTVVNSEAIAPPPCVVLLISFYALIIQVKASKFATCSKNSLYALATIWQKPLYLPCKNGTSQWKKTAETWPHMSSIELFRSE